MLYAHNIYNHNRKIIFKEVINFFLHNFDHIISNNTTGIIKLKLS
jgi:hypothetical protein